MKTKSQELYLDLLKKTLSFTFWPEAPVAIMLHNYRRSLITRLFVAGISRLLAQVGLSIAQNPGRGWPAYAHTMIGLRGLDNLQFCIETVLEEGVEGDLIETGVWRGGACIFMRGVLAAYGVRDRRVFVADSFQGLPKPDLATYPEDKGDHHYRKQVLSVSEEEVKATFQKYGLLDDQVIFLKGWFKDTLSRAPFEKLSILRLDGDMYGSTMDALTSLYPKLSKGGFCIVDDYGLKRCKKAVDDYRRDNQIHDEMKKIDWSASFWRKG